MRFKRTTVVATLLVFFCICQWKQLKLRIKKKCLNFLPLKHMIVWNTRGSWYIHGRKGVWNIETDEEGGRNGEFSTSYLQTGLEEGWLPSQGQSLTAPICPSHTNTHLPDPTCIHSHDFLHIYIHPSSLKKEAKKEFMFLAYLISRTNRKTRRKAKRHFM